jgi:hypothetical protein
MKPFNLEVFDRQFNLLAHTNVEAVSIDYDYLKPNDSEVTARVPMDDVNVGDYIRFTRDETELFGIITSVEGAEDVLLTNIGFQPFPAGIFNTEILFDTNKQGTVALETVLADLITSSWISNADTAQNIQGLSVTTTSSTVSWGMNLKSDTEGMHHCIINFYEVLIARAMSEYGIAIQADADFEAQTVTLTIGKVNAPQTIEADLPNVFEKTMLIHEASKNTNKLDVYNTANYTTVITYYLHTDGTYDTSNTDRITPVVREIQGAEADDVQTFPQAAASAAASVFGETTYNNLIELTCKYDDSLIEPKKIKVGTVVSIISGGVSYGSILTGYKLADNIITLIFGSIRADLTKLIGGK